jgi:L-lactate dehydrogenase complex protein LldG
MNGKDQILAAIRRNMGTIRHDLPETMPEAVTYPNLLSQFIEVSRSVGGNAIVLEETGDLNQRIRALYPEARTIASNLPEITIRTFKPDAVETPHQLNGTDLAVIEGEIGVAENGCVWIQNVKNKAIYFISEYLVILLNKTHIVPTMHEACAQLQAFNYDFGVFLSGPSKTADIEQALVIGAHGAKGVTVILR